MLQRWGCRGYVSGELLPDRLARADVRSVLPAGRQSPHQQCDLLDPETRNMNWYFQYTPRDPWGYDQGGTHIMIDTGVARPPRKPIPPPARKRHHHTMASHH